METVIVELNQRASEYSKPGEYRVQLAQPIIINEGDQLSFRMASIDTLKTSADTIVIDTDTTLTAIYSYYEVDYSLTDKANFAKNGIWAGDGQGHPTFDYYAAYNEVGTEEILAITGTILGYYPPTQGNYSLTGGSFIVGTFGTGANVDPPMQFIATFSYLDQNSELQYIKFSASTVAVVANPDPQWRATAYGTVDPGTQSLNPGQFYLYNLDGSSITQSVIFKTGSFKLAAISGHWGGRYIENGPDFVPSFGPTGSFAPQNGGQGTGYDTEFVMLAQQFAFNITANPLVKTGLVLDLQTTSAVLKAGRYDPGSLAVELTQLFSSADGLVNYNGQNLFQPLNPILTRTDGPLNSSMVFRRVDISAGTSDISFNNSNTYSYNDWAGTEEAIPYFIGASTFSIEYGQAGPVFQLSYAHTPLSNPSRPGEQDIGIFHYVDNANKLQFQIVKAAGGIAIHGLEPGSFWSQSIGLRDKLIVPLSKDSNGVHYYEKQALLNSITEGFQGVGTFMLPATANPDGSYPDPRKVTPIPPAGNPVYIDVTGQSRAIIGELPSENVSEGFFLVEVLNFFRRTGGYLDDQENRINIAAICSTQYLNSNTVTAFADSGIPYVHRGAPYIISEAFVRILDPVTKQPSLGLGPNTTIFLQVDRMLQTDLPMPDIKAPQEAHEGVPKP